MLLGGGGGGNHGVEAREELVAFARGANRTYAAKGAPLPAEFLRGNALRLDAPGAYVGPTVRKAPSKRSFHRAAASMRRSAPSFSDVPPLCPASPPGAAARPADDTGFFVVRGRRVSGLEWIRSRAGDARAALRRAARVCAYHDVALIRISPEEPEPGQPDEDDDDDEGDFDDMSSFDSVFDSELLEAL